MTARERSSADLINFEDYLSLPLSVFVETILHTHERNNSSRS